MEISKQIDRKNEAFTGGLWEKSPITPTTFTPLPSICYLETYFDIGYSVFIIPFKFQRDSKTGTYAVHVSKFRSFTFAILIFFSIFHLVEMWCDSLKGLDPYNPTTYADCIHQIIGTMYSWAMIHIIWFKREKLLHLFQWQETESVFHKQGRNSEKTVKYLPFLLATLLLVNTIGLTVTAKSCFNQHNNSSRFLSYSSTKIPLCYVPAFAYRIFQCFTDLFYLVSVLFFKSLVGNFLWDLNHLSAEKIWTRFSGLRNLISELNDVVGSIVFILTIGSLPGYSVLVAGNLSKSLGTHEGATFDLSFVVIMTTFIVIAVSANRDLTENLKKWVFRNEAMKMISGEQLSIYLHEISSHCFGIGPNGYFKLTPGFLGSFVSLVVTYTVILIQFPKTSPDLSKN